MSRVRRIAALSVLLTAATLAAPALGRPGHDPAGQDRAAHGHATHDQPAAGPAAAVGAGHHGGTLAPPDPAAGVVYDGLQVDPARCDSALVLPGREAPTGNHPAGAGRAAACVHLDEAPPGVDVRKPLATADAVRRDGVSTEAVAAANDAGVPSPAQLAAGSTVTCDGDGTSGYRVQAMYVVAADRPNRYASLGSSIRQWAAGVDDVVNRSAALTGGVRTVRWVHPPGSTGCTPAVLNVTVPAGATADLGATIEAVRAAGYTDRTRKYLMWVDATVYCGIAQMYLDENAAQGNTNNGAVAQYARTDSQCWGRSDRSTEAHELVHTLGGVQDNAPHSTRAGHCSDESDTMCYADGGPAATMQQVCAQENEYLLDCGADDYFSTLPTPGSYLATRWNVADSRFLAGGGDGTTGGTTGRTTRLGVSVAVNPAVPGLPTQATATLAVPAGRTATVSWRLGRTGCLLGTPTAEQTDVTCPADSAAATTVTATAQDSSGDTATATAPLSFATSPQRTVTVATAVDGRTGSYTGCTGVPTPVSGTVTDTATGLGVLGMPVDVQGRSPGATADSPLGTVTTSGTGVGTLSVGLTGPLSVASRSRATGPYQAAVGAAVAVDTAQCATSLSLAAGATDVYAGDRVPVAGRLTRAADGLEVGVQGQTVAVTATPAGSATPRVVGTARTGADGTWALDLPATTSVTLRAGLAASAGFAEAVSAPVGVTVRLPATRLSASVDRTSAYYGQPVVVTGTALRDAGGAVAPIAGATVQVQVTRPGAPTPVTVATGRADATGAFRVPFGAAVGGTLRVSYGGSGVQPAASAEPGELTVANLGTAVTLAATPRTVTFRSAVVATGTVTTIAGSSRAPAVAVEVRLYLAPTGGGTPVLLARTTSTASGSYRVAVLPPRNGTLQARVAGVPGRDAAVSTGVPVAVRARVAVAATRTVRVGGVVTVNTAALPGRPVAVTLDRLVGSTWRAVGTTTTTSAGGARFTLRATARGTTSYRVRTAADRTAAAGASPTVTVRAS